MAKPMCQSCGMPLAKDPQGGARLSDGSQSLEYCSLCMKDGVFTYQGTDAKAYQKYVVDGMVAEGWKRPVAWLLTRQIPRLRRWQPDET